jgi:hypothetical protein
VINRKHSEWFMRLLGGGADTSSEWFEAAIYETSAAEDEIISLRHRKKLSIRGPPGQQA